MLKLRFASQRNRGVLRLTFQGVLGLFALIFWGFMFEQQSYTSEAQAPVPDDGVLFNNYEIKTWEMSPRLYKILAASAIFNILAVVVIAQSNLLTMKGCDSPFVGRVCQVLDTVYVGAVLFGTERDYVDVEYDRIDLGSAEIT